MGVLTLFLWHVRCEGAVRIQNASVCVCVRALVELLCVRQKHQHQLLFQQLQRAIIFHTPSLPPRCLLLDTEDGLVPSFNHIASIDCEKKMRQLPFDATLSFA